MRDFLELWQIPSQVQKNVQVMNASAIVLAPLDVTHRMAGMYLDHRMWNSDT